MAATQSCGLMSALYESMVKPFTDGSTHAAKVTHPRGTGDQNLTNAEIRDKYRKLTHRAITADRQAAIEKAILGIDTLDDIAQLTALLTPAVHPLLN